MRCNIKNTYYYIWLLPILLSLVACSHQCGSGVCVVSCKQEASDRHREAAKEARERADFRTAIFEADSAVMLALECGDTVTIARAYNELATDFRRMGHMEQALRFHYAALEYAEHYSDTVFQARKNIVVSYNGLGNAYLTLEEYDHAEYFFRHALAGEHALGSELGQAINYANLGAIFEHRLQLDSAQAYYEQSMYYNEQIGSCLGIALCHVYYGQIHERCGRYDAALEEYQRATEEFCERGDLWHLVAPTMAIAGLYLNIGQPKKAKCYVDEAMVIAEQIHSMEHLEEAYQLRARYHEQMNLPVQALADYKKAFCYQDSVHGPNHSAEMREICLTYEQRKHDRIIKQLQEADEREDRQHQRILWMSALLLVLILLILLTWAYIMRSRITLLVSRLLERQHPTDHSSLTEADQLWLDEIRNFVEKQMETGSVTITQVAEHMLASVPTIQNRVRLLTGDTIGHLILVTRLEYAKNLLLTTNYSIQEVAERCGFFNHSYFGRIYRKYYGKTPGEERKRKK